MHRFVAIVIATSSVALAHHSMPVQPTAFADDPALIPPRPLVILTPSELDLGDVESTSSSSPTVEPTTIPFEDSDPVLFIPSTSSISPSSPPSTSAVSSTPFPSSTSTALANRAEKRVASSSSPSLTTITGTRTTTSSSTSNPASVPTAFANAAVGLIAIVGLAMAL
ncbi:hypothetical protein THAR02_09690 [Trichoderma harzianum]|uniref:Uncharacterized protein n=1 Tax=Trichoderma harzianum TaxID=5544 RepID=A0A0F9X0L2_TRIHA|nr:hypothetical protein THAR02_09690 [Trichoderma harzianum]